VPYIYHDLFEKAGVEHSFYTIKGGHDYTVWKRSLYAFVLEIFKE
jgi:enterochelin esterase-like enzyme